MIADRLRNDFCVASGRGGILNRAQKSTRGYARLFAGRGEAAVILSAAKNPGSFSAQTDAPSTMDRSRITPDTQANVPLEAKTLRRRIRDSSLRSKMTRSASRGSLRNIKLSQRYSEVSLQGGETVYEIDSTFCARCFDWGLLDSAGGRDRES